jgi:D-serine deaminase-like pyridoxal phosphate-dependent protein
VASPPETLADLAQRWRPELFLVDGMHAAQTPTLVINQDALTGNVAAMRRMLGDRWRPHVKTAKLAWTMSRMVAMGVKRCKCATTLELKVALDAGFEDVLVAVAHRGPAARRIGELAASTDQRVSVLIEDPSCLNQWRGTDVAIFIDMDPGTRRSGIPYRDGRVVRALARAVAAAGLVMRGLHSYEGGPVGATKKDRRDWCEQGYDALCRLWGELRSDGHPIEELVTSGSRTWPWALAHAGLAALSVEHTVSPGTVVYSDARTILEAPASDFLSPAAVVVTRVTSISRKRITLDAGHKAISPSADGPGGVVLGYSGLELQKPSEEHGPATVPDGSRIRYGDMLVVLPSHINATVNLHTHAVIVQRGRVVGVELVSARGHDRPL